MLTNTRSRDAASAASVASFDEIQMQIDLRPRLRSIFFAASCLVVTGLYLSLAARVYFAARFAANPDLPNIQRAARLEPTNAEYQALLGRNFALSGTTLQEGIAV